MSYIAKRWQRCSDNNVFLHLVHPHQHLPRIITAFVWRCTYRRSIKNRLPLVIRETPVNKLWLYISHETDQWIDRRHDQWKCSTVRRRGRRNTKGQGHPHPPLTPEGPKHYRIDTVVSGMRPTVRQWSFDGLFHASAVFVYDGRLRTHLLADFDPLVFVRGGGAGGP